MYIISSKLNSAFSTIGKATADEITAKLEGKTHACHAFAFAWIINSNMRSCSESVCVILNIFVLLDKFFSPHLEWIFIVIELPVTFLSFSSFILARVLSFSSEQYFCTLDFYTFRRPRDLFVYFSIFASLKYIYWVLFGFYGTPGDRTKLALNLHSWKTIYLKTIA